jgi:hypothetical protein
VTADGMRPPRLARRVLRFFAPADVRDSIDGALAELYTRRLTSHGQVSATASYWGDAMSISTRFAIDARSRTPRVIRSLPGAISGLDFRLSARLRVRNPGLTLLAGFGIAVAIGITTGVFGTVDSSIAPRLPLEDAKRICRPGKLERVGEQRSAAIDAGLPHVAGTNGVRGRDQRVPKHPCVD